MRHSLKDGSGYLIIDHRDSPGINPDDIPEKLRSSTIAVGSGRVFEADVQHCTHCQRAVILFVVDPSKLKDLGYCRYCHHYICNSCKKMLALTGKCVPFRQTLETASATEKGIVLTDQ